MEAGGGEDVRPKRTETPKLKRGTVPPSRTFARRLSAFGRSKLAGSSTTEGGGTAGWQSHQDVCGTPPTFDVTRSFQLCVRCRHSLEWDICRDQRTFRVPGGDELGQMSGVVDVSSNLHQKLFLAVFGLELDLEAAGCDLARVLPVLQVVLVLFLSIGRGV